MKISFTLNGKPTSIEAESESILLWALRDTFELTGTKFSCGMAQCGACTVHLDGNPVRSCVLPTSAVSGKSVTTIEGLSENHLTKLQEAWINEQVPQCGYCQPGQIMQATALLQKDSNPSREKIVAHMDGVLCRCGAYMRILKAIESVAKNEIDGSRSE